MARLLSVLNPPDYQQLVEYMEAWRKFEGQRAIVTNVWWTGTPPFVHCSSVRAGNGSVQVSSVCPLLSVKTDSLANWWETTFIYFSWKYCNSCTNIIKRNSRRMWPQYFPLLTQAWLTMGSSEYCECLIIVNLTLLLLGRGTSLSWEIKVDGCCCTDRKTK